MFIIILFYILQISVNFILLCDVLVCNFVHYVVDTADTACTLYDKLCPNGFDLYGSAGTCNKIQMQNACACACVQVILLIQNAICMRQIVTSFVVPLALPYFSTLSHKRHDCREKKVIKHKMF
jgi:hypothetical protein